MPSPEEYLDNLLKDVMNDGHASESEASDGVHVKFFNGLPAEFDDSAKPKGFGASETAAATEGSAASSLTEDGAAPEIPARKDRYDVQDTVNMSPEEIERILSETAGNTAVSESKADRGSVDLETLLQEAEEANLKDISNMLQRADRNEPVDEGIITLLEQAQQQNAEIDWKDIEEQRQTSQPKAEKGLKKLFGKLRREKKASKGGKNSKRTKQKEDYKQAEADAEKTGLRKAAEVKGTEGRTSEKPNEARMSQEDISEREKRQVNSEMDELFGAMEAIGSEQDITMKESVSKQRSLQEAEKMEHRAEELSQGAETGMANTGEDTITESAWPGLQGGLLGNKVEDLSEIQGILNGKTQAELRDQDDGFGISENLGIENDSDDFGVSDALDILGETEGFTGEGAKPGDGEKQKSVGKKKSGREKKPKKEKVSSGKKGLLSRLLDFLTQEDPEVEEEQQIILSDENDAILKELNEENAKKKKKKKKSKKKKNGDKEGGQTDFEDEEESGAKKGKQKKAKPKKVREPKQREPEEPGKRLSKRRVSLIFLICATLGAAILILGNVVIDYADKKKAVSAFYEGDYETCYQNLIGKHLNESQQVMYGKSESILRMRLWMREYEMFVQAGQEPEALDSLLQSVHEYPALYDFSSQWNAAGEVQEIYDQMLAILQSKYGLTEEMAETIANERDDLTYSQMVRAIAGQGDYDGWDEGPDVQDSPQEGRNDLEDLLPEEEELGDAVFAD